MYDTSAFEMVLYASRSSQIALVIHALQDVSHASILLQNGILDYRLLALAFEFGFLEVAFVIGISCNGWLMLFGSKKKFMHI